jgi:hypothetical protein
MRIGGFIFALALLASCGPKEGETEATAGGAASSGAATSAGTGATSTGGATGTGAGSSGSTGGELCPVDGTCVLVEGGPCEAPGGPLGNGCCACGEDDRCASFCRCAAPDTPVATPTGERALAGLRPGDLVLSVDGGEVVAVPVLAVSKLPAPADHAVVRVRLADGRTLEMSPGHPTADGRTFAGLEAGARLGGATVVAIERVPYGRAFTHDILPDSDSGAYFAAGALVGSTLRRGRE